MLVGPIIRKISPTETKVDRDGVMNPLIDKVNALGNISFDTSQFETVGASIRLRNPFSTAMAFSCDLVSTTVTVKAGTLRIHSVGIYRIAETAIILSGNPDWIFISHLRDHSVTSIEHSTTEPESSTTVLRIPLAKYSLVNGSYGLEELCHVGDVNLDAILR